MSRLEIQTLLHSCLFLFLLQPLRWRVQPQLAPLEVGQVSGLFFLSLLLALLLMLMLVVVLLLFLAAGVTVVAAIVAAVVVDVCCDLLFCYAFACAILWLYVVVLYGLGDLLFCFQVCCC